MLIEGLDAWPSHRMALGTEDDLHYLVFPREGGLARLYQLCPIEQKTRFTGPDRQREFLDSFRLRCLPIGEAIAASTPAGPCAMYPMNDSWTDRVAVPGVVLVGDAAGWNDPIIGEGLSIALRDARTVVDVITSGDDWSPAAFDEYGAERKERMRRLCIGAQLETALRCDFTPAGRARRGAFLQQVDKDPMLLAPHPAVVLRRPRSRPARGLLPTRTSSGSSLSAESVSRGMHPGVSRVVVAGIRPAWLDLSGPAASASAS